MVPVIGIKNFTKKVKRFLLRNKINLLGGENEESIFRKTLPLQHS